MLWYDIETKARETVEDLNRPLLDKLIQNNDKIKQIFDVLEEKENRIDKLENIVLKKGEKLDVFEKINVRLAEGVAATKSLENKLNQETTYIKRRIAEVDSKYEISFKLYNELKQKAADIL